MVRSPRAARPMWGFVTLILISAGSSFADVRVQTPTTDPAAVISIRADDANRWQHGVYNVWHLQGRCLIQQDNIRAASKQAVIWVDRNQASTAGAHSAIVYMEGDVTVDYVHGGHPHETTQRRAQTVSDKTWVGKFRSQRGIQFHVSPRGEPRVKPAVFYRGLKACRLTRDENVQPAQFTGPETLPAAPAQQGRRFRIEARSNVKLQGEAFVDPKTNEQIWLIDQGVKVTVEGGAGIPGIPNSDKTVILADRIVVWTSPVEQLDLSRESIQSGETPLEFYLEGNIVFAQGDRVIYAERMYYDVPRRNGVILDVEMLTPVDEYDGLLRLKADVIQQVDRENYVAYGAAVTSSRMGVPSYWLQSETLNFRDVQTPLTDPFTGEIIIDPRTNEPAIEHDVAVSSQNNFIYVGGVPVFYWPTISTPANKPTYYLNQISVKNDSVFGFQLLTDWDMYQVLGFRNPPRDTEWNATFDWLSDRGFGFGTDFRYAGDQIFGIPGPYRGRVDAWGIFEQGLDNLGLDRRALTPEKEFRGRIFTQHRHRFANGWQLNRELGWISDRNFLEQYYEREWDEQKDQTTGGELKRIFDNKSFSIALDTRMNDFFTQTEWLPRADHYVLGQSLLFDRVTWYAHSHAGYARLRTADAPTDPVDLAKFNPLPWEANVDGVRAGTRHELDVPFDAGPVRVVPYALGDVTYWQEDVAGNDALRVYGQTGVRATMPMWKVDPLVQSELFNLDGLAHKVVFESEFFWADASQDLARLALYDPLDDDAQEHFRRRFIDDTFGGAAFPSTEFAPLRFDERFYALRSGMQSWVTAPSTEIADDLMVARVAVRQRWQTKRGMPGQQRTIDWITLDVEGSFFPRAQRDNFGTDLGLWNYDFRWHVGDRFTLLSDGFFDFFGQGLRTVHFGGRLSRPELGYLYVGFRTIEGPITANVLSAALTYRMSEKWIATAGTSYDFSATGNIGQSLSFTRIGESFLIRAGINADVSRGNVGFVLGIEPRFFSKNRLGMVAGVRVPPAGAMGLE